MTADDEHTPVRRASRALETALSADPLERGRVAQMAERLSVVVAGLDDSSPLAEAVTPLATEAELWAAGIGDPDELTAVRQAVELHRRALRIDGLSPNM